MIRTINFWLEQVDVIICRDDGHLPPGLTGNLIVPTDFAPMLVPKLAATIDWIKQPGDLFRLLQVEPGDLWWGCCSRGMTCRRFRRRR